MELILNQIKSDPRYLEGLTYGKPRPGHDEGTVANHVRELEQNLERIRSLLSDEEYWKLLVLVHVHDAFKLEGKRRTGHQVALNHPNSHASLARDFLGEFTQDEDLLAIVLFHDEGHALWQKERKTGVLDVKRLRERVWTIKNIDLYLLFTVIDGFTAGKLKDRSPRWFVDVVNRYMPTPRVYEALKLLEAGLAQQEEPETRKLQNAVRGREPAPTLP